MMEQRNFFVILVVLEMISGLNAYFDPRHIARIHGENEETGSTSEMIEVNTRKI
jgi:hypothetical protein